MIRKTSIALIALVLSVAISCSKSTDPVDPVQPPVGAAKSFSINIGNTAYNLDSLHVTQTSSGYYIRATQKGNGDASQGVSIFVNSKTSNTNLAFGSAGESGKAYVSGNLGGGRNFSSSQMDPATGNVTNSSGGLNFSVANGVLTLSFNASFFNVNGEPTAISVSLKSPVYNDTPDEPNNQFFDFEFNGATYNLKNIIVSPIEKGYAVMGVVSNSLVTLVINTKASNTSVSFGDMEEAGKSGALFNIPGDEIYKTTGRDCGGREIVHNQGQAKLTSIGNIGGYIEGHISGAAFKNESACSREGQTIVSKSFRGYFKIRRIM
jgi:hypothetical protein